MWESHCIPDFSEAVAHRTDERATGARQRMILVDSHVIDAGEIELIGHVIEIELQLADAR